MKKQWETFGELTTVGALEPGNLFATKAHLKRWERRRAGPPPILVRSDDPFFSTLPGRTADGERVATRVPTTPSQKVMRVRLKALDRG